MKMRLIYLICFLISYNITFSQEQIITSEKLNGKKNTITLDSLLLDQGFYYQNENRHEEAIKSFKFGLTKDLAFKNPSMYAKFIEGIAISNLALGKIDGVLKAYKEVLSIKEKVGNAHELFSTHINISDYYKKTSSYNLARLHAIKAYNYAVEISDSKLESKALEKNINLNINKESEDYFKKYIALKEDLIARNINITERLSRSDYLNSEKDKEISNLRIEKVQVEKKLSGQENTSFILGLLSLAVLFFGVGLIFFVSKRKNKEINSYEERNKRILSEQEEATERLLNVREKLSSFSIASEMKEINKFSFYLQEIESIEKNLQEIPNKRS